ncbi:MAG: acetyl-CoA C-acyltransferase [Planctomycetales bacterium]|nr:acetyl-CoA C-acyltransferase [Planctomycetales bacterium]NIN08486.1 acetyl-CoA C-acyltransferase [Planctomycetales bacterium]NIN77620.1 acetyl-CoA C-acyltransferase [Planctomycetales bacterium]NIO34783.1 acetyl-CoA C-acyltransferase [Planctomycetales bacterium]NIO46586.1 acetyl-CoA C-acyltransferase [Planctomycetales bacterium]
MNSSYIIAACRTPIGKFLGSLSSLSATELGAIAVGEAVGRTGIAPEDVQEVILGNVLSAGLGQAPARQAALGGGLPPAVAALTINKVCGSGLKAAMLADQAIRLGEARVIVAGGMESMSRAPYLLRGCRRGWKLGDQQAIDSMIHDGLWCAFEQTHMGQAADYIAASRGVSRADQDGFALESHRRAVTAWQRGEFESQLVPVTVGAGDGRQLVSADEGPRQDTSLQALASLPAAFQHDGTVTAGNAAQLSDGAAAVVVSDAATARTIRSPITARIVAVATGGVEPKEIFVAPVVAVEKVVLKARMTLADIDLVELNEAFAAQMLACLRALKLDADKTNVNGGAIALGHPIGASGARVLVTLLHALAARDLTVGLAALCLGGGNAVAMIVERCEV